MMRMKYIGQCKVICPTGKITTVTSLYAMTYTKRTIKQRTGHTRFVSKLELT